MAIRIQCALEALKDVCTWLDNSNGEVAVSICSYFIFKPLLRLTDFIISEISCEFNRSFLQFSKISTALSPFSIFSLCEFDLNTARVVFVGMSRPIAHTFKGHRDFKIEHGVKFHSFIWLSLQSQQRWFTCLYVFCARFFFLCVNNFSFTAALN